MAKKEIYKVETVEIDKHGGTYFFHPKPSAFENDEVLEPRPHAVRTEALGIIRIEGKKYKMSDYLIYDKDGNVVIPRGKAD